MGYRERLHFPREDGPYREKPLEGMKAWVCGLQQSFQLQAINDGLRDAGAKLIMCAVHQNMEIVVVDATGCETPDHYHSLCNRLYAVADLIASGGRVLIVAPNPAVADNPISAAVAYGLEGLWRTLGETLSARSISVNLVRVSCLALEELKWPLRFLCGTQMAYLPNQAMTLSSSVVQHTQCQIEPVLQGKVALVMGSLQGIGLAITQRLAREGVTVVRADMTELNAELIEQCLDMNAFALNLDIATVDAPDKLMEFISDHFGGVDIVVYNTGNAIAKMRSSECDSPLDKALRLNLEAIININHTLVHKHILRQNGRIVCLSPISEDRGVFSQSDYASTAAALTGYVAAEARCLASNGISINAIAPGRYEISVAPAKLHAALERHRGIKAMKGGCEPRDIAELVCFLSSPGSFGVTGNTFCV